MNKFIEFPATSKSISQRRPIFGVGINDADYITSPTIDGRQLVCPYYLKWSRMIQRCYSDKFKLKYPTYKDCTADPVWHKFSAFKEWMQGKDWHNKELDKDILFYGNKVYGPDKCLFVSRRVNVFLTDRGGSRGDWPIGVSFCKKTGKYRSMINRTAGKPTYIGHFVTPEEAHAAWRAEKSKIAIKIAQEEGDQRVSDALIAISKRLMGR